MSEEIGRLSGSKTIRDAPISSGETADRNRQEIYEFGPFRLEPAERKLLRGSEVVALTPKVFDMLVMLVRNSRHLLEKDDLIRSLWPDSFVEEGNLSNNIFVLRKALGNDHEYIETVPRRGYRFVGAVRQLPGAAKPPFEYQEADRAAPADRRTQGPVTVAALPRVSRRWRKLAVIVGTAVAILAIGAALWWRSPARLHDASQWVQLTRFPDSVTQPALSPDGRMLAFIRGYSTFVGPGQIYVKILPDGEPVQLTHDELYKMSPTFSPDGSRIAYTTLDTQFHWDTWVVPTLGGEPHLLLQNASGLVWTAPQRVLFSEIKMGVHMGIVAADESRIGARDIYLPEVEPAMAHESSLSPDGKWVLLVEMDEDHIWLPCRLVPMDSSSRGRHVGPLGAGCTAAAWSRDGQWMFFSASLGGASHIWRQRFPDGQPEQITSGPTEEEGLAIASDGRSLVTAVALQNTSIWVHNAQGERPISLEGNGYNPRFTPDGKKLCYLIVRRAPNEFAWYRNPGELHIADLESGRSTPLLIGLPVLDYDISHDGQRVVIWTTDSEGKSRLWVARLDRSSAPGHLPSVAQIDRSSAPVQIPNVEGVSPRFGPDGDIFFRHLEGVNTFVYRVHPDGTGLRKALDEPIFILHAVSPDGRWILGWAPVGGNGPPSMQALPLDGGRPMQLGNFIYVRWPLDGHSVMIGGYLVPLHPGEVLPQIPARGFNSEDEIARVPGARRIDADGVVLGPSAGVYAFYKGTVQRNLYRIPIS